MHTPRSEARADGFHGRMRCERRTPSARVVLSAYDARTELAAHGHPAAHLCVPLRGRYRERVAGRQVERAPFDVVWYSPGAEHAEVFHEPGVHLLVELVAPGHEVRRDPVDTLPGAPVLAGVVRLLRLATDPSADTLALDDAVADVVARADIEPGRREERTPPGWLARVEEAVHDRFREALSLDELARLAGVSTPHLARTWRRFRGETLGDTVRALRTREACRRLAADDAPLARVALDAGFADQSHMGRALRRAVGATPAALRRAVAGA